MRILLDTHVLLWWASNDRKLSSKARRLLQSDAHEVMVSAVAAWEIATKVRLRKLLWSPSLSVRDYALEQGFTLLAISFEHAERAGAWPQAHGDPFDRMLAAQSQIEAIPLLTSDPRILEFGVKTLW